MKRELVIDFEKRFPGGPLIRVEGCAVNLDSRVTVLFGASGSGKTTLLRCVAGLERPDAGIICFGDELWNESARGIFLATRHRRIGLVPQDHALFPHLTVSGNIGYGLAGMDATGRRHRVGEMLEWLGLDGLENRLPRELSGGQRQRVALARALAPRPRFLLLDEPLSALDQPTRRRLRGELRGLLEAAGIPALLVTHDRQEAAALGDDLLVMHDGHLVQHGPVTDVFSKPSSADVADILAVETIVQGRVVSIRDGMAAVNVGGVTLHALAGDLSVAAKQVSVCIRAEDVSLSALGAAVASPRNRLPAIVNACLREGPLVRVELDCGFLLVALLTPQGCEELALAPGSRVLAEIKAPKIHLIARHEV